MLVDLQGACRVRAGTCPRRGETCRDVPLDVQERLCSVQGTCTAGGRTRGGGRGPIEREREDVTVSLDAGDVHGGGPDQRSVSERVCVSKRCSVSETRGVSERRSLSERSSVSERRCVSERRRVSERRIVSERRL